MTVARERLTQTANGGEDTTKNLFCGTFLTVAAAAGAPYCEFRNTSTTADALVRQLVITLTQAVATSVGLVMPSSVDGTAGTPHAASQVVMPSLWFPDSVASLASEVKYDNAWDLLPTLGTTKYVRSSQGILSKVGDSVTWTFPDDGPFRIQANGLPALLWNLGSGAGAVLQVDITFAQ